MCTLDKIVSLLSTQKKTQKELTDYLELKKGVFTQWKAGGSTSYLKHITKISEFLDVSADYLLGTEKSPLSDLDSRLQEIFVAMDDDNRAKLAELAQILLDAQNSKK